MADLGLFSRAVFSIFWSEGVVAHSFLIAGAHERKR